MGISIDGTFAVQIVSFLLLWVVLKRLLFDPVLQVLDERDRRTRGNREAADQLRARGAAYENEHAATILAVRRAVSEEAQEARKRAVAEERQALGSARDAAAADLNRTRGELAGQMEEARRRLSAQADTLAAQIVGKVLGRRAG